MKKIPFSAIKLLNTLLVLLPFLGVWFGYYEPLTLTARSKQVCLLMLLVYCIVFYTTCTRLDGFRVSIRRIGEMIFSQIIAVGVTDAAAAVMIWMLSIHFPNLLPGFVCFLLQCAVIVVTVFAAHRLFFATHPPKRAIVVFDVRHGMEELISDYGLERRYDVQASYPVEEVVSDLSKLDGAQDVFLCGIHSHERNIMLKYCVEKDIRVFMIPRVGDVMMSGAERMHMFHLPFIRATRYKPPLEFRIMKRAFDILVSGVALLLL